MEPLLRYRGRTVTRDDVHQIRTLVAAHPHQSRRALSETLCSAWNWRQANGASRAMVCRGLMLALWRAGHIELPAVRRRPPNPLGVRTRPQPVTVDTTALRMSLRELGPLTFVPVRRTGAEGLFNSLMQAHHYLGYAQPVGEHLKFLVYAGSRPVALFAWSSAPRHLGPRDRYLGWSPEVRRANIAGIAYNTRFLILPWVEVEHLASHLLGRMTRELSGQWQRVYGHPVYFAETFIDPTRFRGTCYRAANWQYLGQTQGRGKADLTHQPNRTLKDILGLPLCADYRERLICKARGRNQRSPPERIELSVGEISAIVERPQTGALSAQDHAKLKAAIDTFALITAQLQTKDASLERLRRMIFGATTESTHNVLGYQRGESLGAACPQEAPAPRPKPPGHGRNAAAAYTDAEQVTVAHLDLHGGEAYPGCTSGKLYAQNEPAKRVRITGMAPLSATVYSCERLRCNLCGEVFTAPAPEGVGDEKYDATATSMVGLLKYGAGLPFNRIEKLQDGMGILLPAEMLRGAFQPICSFRKNVPFELEMAVSPGRQAIRTAHFFDDANQACPNVGRPVACNCLTRLTKARVSRC